MAGFRVGSIGARPTVIGILDILWYSQNVLRPVVGPSNECDLCQIGVRYAFTIATKCSFLPEDSAMNCDNLLFLLGCTNSGWIQNPPVVIP